MIKMDISLNALPLDKMRAIITRLEDLNIGITSARLDKSINQTRITFKSERADIDRDAKAILRVLRSYAVYKKQMPKYSDPSWDYSVLGNGQDEFILMLAKI